MRKRFAIAAAALVAMVMVGCLPEGDSTYSYEGTYVYMPYIFMEDTTYVSDLYDDPDDLKYYLDTTAARYFLNKDLYFAETFSVTGDSYVDADTQMYNLVIVPFKDALPDVQALDYSDVFAGVDSVYCGNVTVTYQIKNVSTGITIVRDTITNYEIAGL